MKTTSHTEISLSEVKFADLGEIYNTIAAELSLPTIKKFKDKPTGIARILKVQAALESAKPVAAKPVAAKPVAAKPVAAKPVAAKPVAAKPVAAKPVAAKPVAANLPTYDLGCKFGRCSNYNPAKGSIGRFIFDLIDEGCFTGNEIVEMIISDFKKPRATSNPPDRTYSRVCFIWLITRGHISEVL